MLFSDAVLMDSIGKNENGLKAVEQRWNPVTKGGVEFLPTS